jgi:hypothetical protein
MLNLILVRGLLDAVGYSERRTPMAVWVLCTNIGHYGAIENRLIEN